MNLINIKHECDYYIGVCTEGEKSVRLRRSPTSSPHEAVTKGCVTTSCVVARSEWRNLCCA
eukprot:3155570-Amphidinium_carterae.2